METFLMVVQFVVSIALVVVVLLQQSKGEGLGSIGGGGAQMFFNQPKGFDAVLEKATKVLAVVFMALSITLAII